MKLTGAPHNTRRGSVLVIVLWIAFGLVSIALYFGHTMSFELQAADNSVAAMKADHAIEGAARYLTYLLANAETPGTLPYLTAFQSEEVPLGESTFWLIGRHDEQTTRDIPYFGLVDEASKLNLNSTNLTAEMLALLPIPGMTPQIAGAIIDWRDADEEIASTGGAENESYARGAPPYRCKNAKFETVEELRLVYGVTPEILYGEDWNRNGVLDPNENDGDTSPPYDNRDGRLDPGLIEFVTVYSREPNQSGSQRVNVSNGGGQELSPLLLERGIAQQRANEITQRLSGGGAIRSLLEFYVRSGMTPEEFALIETDITVASGEYVEGLVNVNTASAPVLACIPGIGPEKAESVVAYRLSNTSATNSIAWVTQVLDQESAIAAGPHITGRSYQFTADVAAVGHYGRGYRRTQFVFDTSEGTPKIIYRRDLTGLGWALGRSVRQRISLATTRP